MQKVSIFVDVQNIYYTTKEFHNCHFNYNAFWAKATSNREVVKAIAYAINRQEMLNSFFEGKGQLISGPFAPGSWAYNLDINPIPYSPENANRLLDEAGFTERTKDGTRKRGSYTLEFSMMVPISKENETTKRVILSFQNYLEDVGIIRGRRWAL